MKQNLTLEQVEKRFAEIDALPPVEPTPEEIAAIAEAEAEDPTEWVTLEECKAQTKYNGKLSVRIPKELHRALAKSAKENGVSLNKYVLYKLTK